MRAESQLYEGRPPQLHAGLKQFLASSCCTHLHAQGGRWVEPMWFGWWLRWLPLGRGVKLGNGASPNGHKAEVAPHRHPPGDAVGQEHILRQTPLIFSLSHNPALWWTTNGASAYNTSVFCLFCFLFFLGFWEGEMFIARTNNNLKDKQRYDCHHVHEM